MADDIPGNPATPPAPASAPAPKAPAQPPANAPAAAPQAQAPVKPASEPTLLTDTPKDDKPAPAPADWPAEWRQKLAGADQKLLKRLERFGAPNDILKSYLALEQKLSSGEVKASLPDKPTPEQLAAYRAENGIPEKPEGYFEKALPEGLVVGEDEKPLFEDFFKAVHGKNWTPAQARDALEWYKRFQDQQQTAVLEADRAYKAEAEDALRAEWGAEFRANLNSIHALLDTAPAGVKEKMLGARVGQGTALGNDPDVLRWLSGLARELNPVTTVVPGSGGNIAQSVAEEMANLQKLMGDHSSEYWKGPKAEQMQARYRDLVSWQARQAR